MDLTLEARRMGRRLEAKVLRVEVQWRTQRSRVQILMTIVHAGVMLEEKPKLIIEGEEEGVPFRSDKSYI